MSEYIKSLRQHLGHTPLLQVGASVIVINEAGQMLMQKRTDCGSWGYAGGSVELGESVEQTAERELFEETGLKATKARTAWRLFRRKNAVYLPKRR